MVVAVAAMLLAWRRRSHRRERLPANAEKTITIAAVGRVVVGKDTATNQIASPFLYDTIDDSVPPGIAVYEEVGHGGGWRPPGSGWTSGLRHAVVRAEEQQYSGLEANFVYELTSAGLPPVLQLRASATGERHHAGNSGVTETGA